MRFRWNRAETDLERELAHHLHELTAERATLEEVFLELTQEGAAP